MRGEHIVDGQFQSDKYPWCKPGFVPLKLTDPMAQALLWAYAQIRRSVDADFSDDLQAMLRATGFPVKVELRAAEFGTGGYAVTELHLGDGDTIIG